MLAVPVGETEHQRCEAGVVSHGVCLTVARMRLTSSRGAGELSGVVGFALTRSWWKRRWRCRQPQCGARTWTEDPEHVDAQAVLTRRAGVEVCRQVGENARPVSQLADELGVCWWTVMNADIEHGTPLVDDPERIGPVRQLGVDETLFLAANRHHATVHTTGLVDIERHVVIEPGV